MRTECMSGRPICRSKPRAESTGRDKIIGISTHNVEQARAAEAGGADYIGFGAMYPGGLRNNAAGMGLDQLRADTRRGEDSDRRDRRHHRGAMAEVLAAGADAAAIITDVLNAPDIGAKVRSILALSRK